MNIQLSKWVIIPIVIGLCILAFALLKGCQKSKEDKAKIQKLMDLTDSFAVVSERAVSGWAASKQAYEDTLEFERGQRMLAEAQKERTEDELNKANSENQKLIKKYKSQDYRDTATEIVPHEFVDDCRDCFTRLEITDNLTLKYKKEVKEWTSKFNQETKRLLWRIDGITEERDNYHRRVDSLTKKQEKAVSAIRQKGRLYLSWGVLWSPWPTGAGGGLMYQTPRNVIFGLKGYYGAGKTTVETTINFPLSLRIK